MTESTSTAAALSEGTELSEMRSLGIPSRHAPHTPVPEAEALVPVAVTPDPPLVAKPEPDTNKEAANTQVEITAQVDDIRAEYQIQVLNPEPLQLTTDDLNALLVWCAKNGASDLFVYSSSPVKANVHGRLVALTTRRLEPHEVLFLLTRATPNAEGTLLQGKYVDTRYDFAPSRTERYGFRVCATRCMEPNGANKGYEVVFRMLPYDIPSVSSLQIEADILNAAYPRQGLVLVTGATGHGKSTLLASLLQDMVQKSPRRLLTYEAPPEYPLAAVPNQLGMVVQQEVYVHVESFADGVRNALRRAPDCIFIGECRDSETTAMALRAAETGHTVFSTVHTNNVVTTIDRMADEFPLESSWTIKAKLINAMRLIVNQQLVPKVGGGRIALREYLVFTEPLRNALLDGGPVKFPELLREAMEHQGRRMAQDAKQKFEAGLISRAEYKVVTSAHE